MVMGYVWVLFRTNQNKEDYFVSPMELAIVNIQSEQQQQRVNSL